MGERGGVIGVRERERSVNGVRERERGGVSRVRERERERGLEWGGREKEECEWGERERGCDRVRERGESGERENWVREW